MIALDVRRDADQLQRAAELLRRGGLLTVRTLLRHVLARVDEAIRYEATTGRTFPRPRSVI